LPKSTRSALVKTANPCGKPQIQQNYRRYGLYVVCRSEQTKETVMTNDVVPTRSRVLRVVSLAVLLAVALTSHGGPAHAQSAPQPVACAEAVKIAKNSVWLRMQGGDEDATAARETTKLHLYLAETAAAEGNQTECWYQMRLSRIGSR
jgi:hypothetical protein